MSSLDAFVRSLTSAPPPIPVPVRVGVSGRRGRVRGLSVREIIDVAARHPGSRDLVWSLFGLGPRPDGEVSTRDAAALFDVLQTALDHRGFATVWRLSRLPAPVFDRIVGVVIEATMPDPEGVEELFRPHDGAAGEERDEHEDGPWLDPVVVLTTAVLSMQERGFADPASWTPGRLLYAASRLAERDADMARRTLLDRAVAFRLGNADTKSWKRAIGEIGGRP